jgi:hypothetical protein
MGYGMYFPTHQVGGQPELWGIRSYGVSGVWVKRSSTVLLTHLHRSHGIDDVTGVTSCLLEVVDSCAPRLSLSACEGVVSTLTIATATAPRFYAPHLPPCAHQ